MGRAPAYPVRILTVAVIAAACGALAGCVDLPKTDLLAPPPVDQTSAVARQVEAASANQADFPRFKDMPRKPTDVRPARAWTRSIYDILRLRRQMQVETYVAAPRPDDAAAFVKQAQAYTSPPGSRSAAAAANLDKQTSAFVEGARERATPPSPSR